MNQMLTSIFFCLVLYTFVTQVRHFVCFCVFTNIYYHHKFFLSHNIYIHNLTWYLLNLVCSAFVTEVFIFVVSPSIITIIVIHLRNFIHNST